MGIMKYTVNTRPTLTYRSSPTDRDTSHQLLRQAVSICILAL